MADVEKVARAIMMARPDGDCIVKDWQAEMDNPHVATAYAQAQAALSAIDPVALVQAGIDAAAAECAKQREDFLSPQYAVGQPISSMMERFACDECGNAIRALSASDVLKEMCGE